MPLYKHNWIRLNVILLIAVLGIQVIWVPFFSSLRNNGHFLATGVDECKNKHDSQRLYNNVRGI